MNPALTAASAVTMANTGKMRGSVAESSKKSAVSKLLLKPTRLPKTASSGGVKGRDNLGFMPGPGRSEADMADLASPGSAIIRSSTSTGANGPSRCRDDNIEISEFEQIGTNCGPGTRQNLLVVDEGQLPISEEGCVLIRGCDEIVVGETTFRQVPEEGVYHAGSLSAVRNEVLANAIPLSKCGSTTALETLSSRRSESPIYEELDFKSASFRELNSDSLRRLESPNISDSSAELSNPRLGRSFPTRHFEHRRQYSSPSCGVRIAEMRATRKNDGLRLSPSSTATYPVVQHKSMGSGIDRRRSQPSEKYSPASTKRTIGRSTSSQAQGGESQRSSLDLNVTYVEYFDETRASAPDGSQTTASVCSPVDASLSHGSSISSSLAEATNRTSSSPMNSLQCHRRTATTSSLDAERDYQAVSLRMPFKFVETSTQTGVGGPAKRQLRPTGFTGSENRFTKSSSIRKPSESQSQVTKIDSFLRPLTVRRSVSEPADGGGPPSDDCSGSILSSPDTLVDSEISLSEDTAANDDLVSSETTDDDNSNTHSIRPDARPPSLGIRAAQKRPQPSPPGRLPAHLQGAMAQRRHQPDPIQSAVKSSESSAPLMRSSASCLGPSREPASHQQQQQNSPAPLASTSTTKLSIQRIENFGQVVAESKNKVSVKLSKSTSSTDLNRNISHLQAPIFRRNKPIGNPIGLPSNCTSASKSQNPRPKIPPSPTPVRTTVRRVQSSDIRPAPVSNHSSTVCVSSKSVSKSVSTVKRDSGSTSMRSDERSRTVGCDKDSLQSSTPKLRVKPLNAPVAVSNKLTRQHTFPSSEGSGKPLRPSSRPPSTSDNLAIPFSLQQQLSPIAERSPLPRTSTSSGESISGNVTRNCRGQVSPRVLPFSGDNSTATQFYRNLSSSQRALSMSKISSAKSTSPLVASGPTSTKCDMRQPMDRSNDGVAASVSSTKLVSEDSISKTNELSKSFANIFEKSFAAKLNAPSAVLQRTASGGRRLNSSSCVALNVCPEPHKLLQNKVPDGTNSRQSTRTNDMKSEEITNVSIPSYAGNQTPDNATSVDPIEPRVIPVRVERTNEVKPSGIAEWTGLTSSSRLRTPTDFNNGGKKSEKRHDREISTSVLRGSPRTSPRTSTSQTLSDRNEEGEAVVTPASAFKQLQLKHVKPYTSVSNRGASIAETFAKSQSTVEGGNVCYKVAASVERHSGASCHDLKTNPGPCSNSGVSLAHPAKAPSTQQTGLDFSSDMSSVQEQTNRSDNLVPSSGSCNLDNSLDAAIKTKTCLPDTDRKSRQMEEDTRSSSCTPESSSHLHSVSNLESSDILASDRVVKMNSDASNDGIFKENHDTDAASPNPSENTNRVSSQEIDSRSDPITRRTSGGDTDQVTHAMVSEQSTATDVSVPDLIQLSASTSYIGQTNASQSSHMQSGKSQTADSRTDADDVTDRFNPYATMSSQCVLSDTDHSSFQLSGDEELFSETEGFDSTTKGDSDCGVSSDFSEKTLQRDDRGIPESDSSMEQLTSASLDLQQSDVTDAETLTDKDCLRSCCAAEIKSQVSHDLSTPRKTETVKMDHGSQTTLSDVGCLGDSILLATNKRNSLILQNKISVDQDTPLRDIEKFVVTYESANIIVLERADSISCPAPLDLKDEFYDRPSKSDLPVSLTSPEISQKWGKKNMSCSRSADLRMVTSPKGESGNLPLSESGYDSWKSQSSKSSMRFLKLSDSEACTLSGGSNLSEAMNRRSGLEGTYDRCTKDSELRRSGIQQRFGATSGYPYGCSSRDRPAGDGKWTLDATGVTSPLASRKYCSVENRLRCVSSGSETEVDPQQETNNDVDIQHLGLQCNNDTLNADGGEIDASCNYFQDDDDVSLTLQASATTIEDCFRGREIQERGGEGFSSSFSSFPSSSSSLMETIESMSLNRSDSNEGFAEVWSAISTERQPNSLCLRPSEGKTAWSICRDSSDRSVDLTDFACGSCYELSSSAAAFHSRDYHNRIYKLDFGAGDSGDLPVDPAELDLGDEEEQLLFPSSTWLEEGRVQTSDKIPGQPANSAVKNRQRQSLKCGNSKSGPLRPSSRDFEDQNSKHSGQPDDTHSYTFPLAVRKVPTEGGVREQEEARAVVENCQLVSKLNVKSRRRQEKETFYENMCDELLEGLEANLSDSDNTPSPTARDLEANGDELTCVGERDFNGLASNAREKPVLYSKKTIPSEEAKTVMPISREDSTLGAKDERTHCRWHTDEQNINATVFQLHESGREKSTGVKFTSEELPLSDKATCHTPTTSIREASTDSVPHKAIVSLEPSGHDGHTCESNQLKQAPDLSDSSLNVPKDLLWVSQYCINEQKLEDLRVRLSTVDCEETLNNKRTVCSSLAEGSRKDDLDQKLNASSLATLPLVEPEVVIRSSDCSPSDAVKTLPSKDEMKSGSSASLLTRYFPGLLRRQSKEIAERRSGRKHDDKFAFSRNSAPVSYDRKSKDITEQEPRSVRDVIRKFEDKTAAQASATLGKGSRSSIAAEKPSSEDHKASSGKRSNKVSKKSKS